MLKQTLKIIAGSTGSGLLLELASQALQPSQGQLAKVIADFHWQIAQTNG